MMIEQNKKNNWKKQEINNSKKKKYKYLFARKRHTGKVRQL